MQLIKALPFTLLLAVMLSCQSGQWQKTAAVAVPKAALELRANEGLYYHNDQPFTGTAELKDVHGQLIAQEQFTEGKRHGTYTKWYGSGLMSYQAHYKAGRLHGQAHSWWSNGQLRSASYFEQGVAEGTQRQWYSSGALFKEMNLLNGKEHGLQRAWRENGKIYNNYEAKNGRIFGLKRANLCFELKDEEVQYAD